MSKRENRLCNAPQSYKSLVYQPQWMCCLGFAQHCLSPGPWLLAHGDPGCYWAMVMNSSSTAGDWLGLSWHESGHQPGPHCVHWGEDSSSSPTLVQPNWTMEALAPPTTSRLNWSTTEWQVTLLPLQLRHLKSRWNEQYGRRETGRSQQTHFFLFFSQMKDFESCSVLYGLLETSHMTKQPAQSLVKLWPAQSRNALYLLRSLPASLPFSFLLLALGVYLIGSQKTIPQNEGLPRKQTFLSDLLLPSCLWFLILPQG